MPSAMTVAPTLHSLNKRRRDDDESDLRQHFTSYDYSSQPSLVSAGLSRRLAQLPATKRSRILDEDDIRAATSQAVHHDNRVEQQQEQQQSYSAPVSRAVSSPPLSPHSKPAIIARPAQPPRTTSAALLSPCHLCYRKPTKKSDLEQFSDCMGCDRRTCNVCMRTCHNWLPETSSDDMSASFTMMDATDDEHPGHHTQEVGENTGRRGSAPWYGHREKVCRHCCVEQGADGNIVCLGCLSGLQNS